MGEWERKAKAKPHEQKTDLVSDATVAAIGGSDAEIIVRCQRTSSHDVPFGAVVRLVDHKRPRVDVFLAGMIVGEVCEEDTRMLREQFGIERQPGSSFGGHCLTAVHAAELNVRVEV